MCGLLISAYFNNGKVVTQGEKSHPCIARDWPGQEHICAAWSQQKCRCGLPGSSARCSSACNRQNPESLEMAQIRGVIFFLMNFVLELGEKCEIFI